MYERSAIVLEKYLNKVFGPDKESDIRVSYETFKSNNRRRGKNNR